VKTAPHFGHLIFASFDTPPHPNEKIAKITNAMKMLSHFRITLHLLSLLDTIALSSSVTRLLPDDTGQTNNKKQLRCQEKNITGVLCSGTVSIEREPFLPNHFFFVAGFLVVFFVVPHFFPYAITLFPPK
jgi:hypothetical protein